MRPALSGIGAASLVASVLTAIAAELWFDGVLVFPAGPPRFEAIGFIAYAAGASIALRLGGWRSAAGVLLFLVVTYFHPVLIGWLRGTPGPDLDFLAQPAWAYSGFAIGLVLALRRRGHVPLAVMLEAAGAYFVLRLVGAVIADGAYGLTWTGGPRPQWMDLIDLGGALWSAGAGLLIGGIYGRRLTSPELVGLAIVSALVSAVIVAHQGAMAWGDGPTWFLAMASGVIGGIGIIVGGAWTRLRAQPFSLGFAAP